MARARQANWRRVMNRRSFIASILAAGAAPAIVRADSLMRIVSRDTVVILPEVLSPAEARRIAERMLMAHYTPVYFPESLFPSWASH